jgi:hypothetical protein
VPLCDRLIELLRPVCRELGPVIDLKKAEDETARLQRVTGIRWRRNALRHSFCSYRVAITGDIPLVYIESGNSVQMISVGVELLFQLCRRCVLSHLAIRPLLGIAVL